MRVHGVGSKTTRLMFVGEGPGQMESQTGIPFHPDAPAGAELTRYLNGYSLPTRGNCWITNLVKEWGPGLLKKKQEVTADDVARDEWELKVELDQIQPWIVCTLGRWSTRWFLGPDADMDACHGLLFLCDYCAFCGWRKSALTHSLPVTGSACSDCGTVPQRFYVVPVYHPAAGLHQPDLAARTAHGLAQLSLILKLPHDQWWSRAWTMAPKGVYTRVETISLGTKYPYGIDTEFDPKTGEPWGFSVAHTPGEGYVLERAGAGGVQLYTYGPGGPADVQVPPHWVFHFYGADAPKLAAMGIPIDEDRFDDTGVMAYLLGVEPQALKDLALRHLGRVRPTFEDLFYDRQPLYGKPGKDKVKVHKKTGLVTVTPGKPGKLLKATKLVIKTMDQVPEQVATDYAGADADDTISLKPILWQKVQDLGMAGIYEIDRRVLPLYSRMEQAGLPVDPAHFKTLGKDLADELEVRTMALQYEYPDFNPGSPDQVAALLFDHLKLPGYKKTPTGKRFTTNDKILSALAPLHPAVQAIIDWREVQKLKSTFVDPLLDYCRPAPDGSGLRLYFQLLPTRVVSGRLAAKDPNVLAFPKYTPLGKKIRKGFRSVPGRLLGSFDLNQIELRVLCLDSGSQSLKEMFLTGADIHGRTGAKIFGGSPELYAEGAKRVAAKAVNFSIPMGTTGYGLAEQMRRNGYPFPELAGATFKNRKERMQAEVEVCTAWINGVLDLWDLRPYISEKHAEARRYGYVSCRWGRKRFLPSVLSPNPQIREAALREAQAFGPQAGARGFMKTIEWRVWREVIQPLQKDGYYIEPVLDIHDDLTCEFQADLADVWMGVVGSIFNSTFNEAIPITAKGGVGQCWGDL